MTNEPFSGSIRSFFTKAWEARCELEAERREYRRVNADEKGLTPAGSMANPVKKRR